MISRIFGCFIVLFWLTMTALLVQKVWFPAESRLAVVSPQVAFDLFASRNESVDLDVYEDKGIVGHLHLSPVHLKPDSPLLMRLNANGFVDLPPGPLLEAGARLRVTTRLAVRKTGDLEDLDLTLELDRPSVEIHVALVEEKATLEVKANGTVVFATGAGAGAGDSALGALATALLSGFGISEAEIGAARATAEQETGNVKITARHGEIAVDGKVFSGYIVSAGPETGRSGKSFRFYIDNTGEVIRIETPGYRLVSESFRPDGAKLPDTDLIRHLQK